MFLHQLEQSHKKDMLDLAWTIINCDDDIHQNELEMLENLKFEMRYFAKPEQRPLDDILRGFLGASSMIKRIVLLECTGMVLADEVVVEEEEKILHQIAERFQIDQSSIETSFDIVRKLLSQHQRAISFISGS